MKNEMIRRSAPWLLVGLPCLALGLAAAAAQQAPNVVPVSQEPHHHLMFKNDYVQAYHVMAQYGNNVQMHRHEYDMISIQEGATETTVHYPDKPDVRQSIADGQIRYQLAGLVHSTEVMRADLPFNNNTIALIHPQTNKRNLCVAVLAGEPLHCADADPPSATVPGLVVLPEMATDQTRVVQLTVAPGADPSLKTSGPAVIVALDEGKVIVQAGQNKKTAKTLLHPGDAIWLDDAAPALVITSKADHEARLVALLLKP